MTVDPKKKIEQDKPYADGGCSGERGGGGEGYGGHGKANRRDGKNRNHGESRGESRGGANNHVPSQPSKANVRLLRTLFLTAAVLIRENITPAASSASPITSDRRTAIQETSVE